MDESKLVEINQTGSRHKTNKSHFDVRFGANEMPSTCCLPGLATITGTAG